MERILIVDDNPDIREVLGTYAAKEGFEPITAKDGFEALDLFRKTSPAVILLDVMMPGMDGYRVCERLRSESDVPIILITAKGEDYERVMGLDIGADDYIVKPFNANEVMARVRAVLRRMARVEQKEEKKILSISNLTINIESYRVYVGAEKLPLTTKEVETMWILAEKPVGPGLFWRQPYCGFPHQETACQTGQSRSSGLGDQDHLGTWLQTGTECIRGVHEKDILACVCIFWTGPSAFFCADRSYVYQV